MGRRGEDEDRGETGRKSLERRKYRMKKLFAFFGMLFVGLMTAGLGMAAEGAAAGNDSAARVAIAISAGIAVAIAGFGAALGQGRVGAAAMESIGRNPNAADRLFLPLVLTLALLEALALYGFVIAILLQGKI
jgi:F-type H+-transporting ATPase subunit c